MAKGKTVTLQAIKERIKTGVMSAGVDLSVEDFAKLKNAHEILNGRNPNEMNTIKNRNRRRARRTEKRSRRRGNATRGHAPGRPTNNRLPRVGVPAQPVLPAPSELASTPTSDTSARELLGQLSEPEWDTFVEKAKRQKKSLKSVLTKAGYSLKDGEDPRKRESWKAGK